MYFLFNSVYNVKRNYINYKAISLKLNNFLTDKYYQKISNLLNQCQISFDFNFANLVFLAIKSLEFPLKNYLIKTLNQINCYFI